MIIAGVDEVGRGPLVGSVVTAAVILDPENPVTGLTDSKKLSEKKRNAFFHEIKEKALCWCIAEATAQEVDELNIFQATMVAMKRAVEGLTVQPDMVKVDGNKVPDWHYASEAVVKGDLLIPEISAASILAKVTRDAQMQKLHEQYPQYQFDKHKGYPTKLHMALLQQHGPIAQHRRSFKPVSALIDKGA